MLVSLLPTSQFLGRLDWSFEMSPQPKLNFIIHSGIYAKSGKFWEVYLLLCFLQQQNIQGICKKNCQKQSII